VTGRELNLKWKVDAKHALYRETGNWYHQLKEFPGALFDAKGYVIFETEEEYRSCPYLQIGKQIGIPNGISSIPTYVQVIINGSGVLIDVERQNLNDDGIDLAIREDRLRIGMVPTDSAVALIRQRRGQERVRQLTLLNYDSMCALCDVNVPSLLTASHIVGWAEAPEARGMLSNVICLCRFHDVLFEQGYWSLADDLTVLRKPQLRSRTIAYLLDNVLQFRRPHHHPPVSVFLHQHRIRCGLERL